MTIGWAEYVYIKDMDAFKRMFSEMLVYTFNDILSKEWYEYHMVKWLNEQSLASKKKLDKHNEAIDWLLDDREPVRNICFIVLGIENMSKDQIFKAILNKFQSSKKFLKFFSCYCGSFSTSEQREILQRNKEELQKHDPEPEVLPPELSGDEEFDILAAELQAEEEAREGLFRCHAKNGGNLRNVRKTRSSSRQA
jgi:hypothetical protein